MEPESNIWRTDSTALPGLVLSPGFTVGNEKLTLMRSTICPLIPEPESPQVLPSRHFISHYIIPPTSVSESVNFDYVKLEANLR